MLEREIFSQFSEGILFGAVVCCGTIAEEGQKGHWGYADKLQTVPLRYDSIFDIASVTKAMACTSALLLCKDRGLLDFDQPFTDYLPEYKAKLTNKITVRDLAIHVSGFGAQTAYNAISGKEIKYNLLNIVPEHPYGQFLYSCWNFHLLSMIVENLSKKDFAEFCTENIFVPLEMTSTSLAKPVTNEAQRLTRSCQTEGFGQISDFIAQRMYRDSFSCGNAGAFSCADDLQKFCKCILRGGLLPSGKRFFSAEAIKEISTPVAVGDGIKRSFGWVAEDEFKPKGFSENCIYHSGWSGQTVFIDLERGFYAIVLTVRSAEKYDEAKTRRPKIIEALGNEFFV